MRIFLMTYQLYLELRNLLRIPGYFNSRKHNVKYLSITFLGCFKTVIEVYLLGVIGQGSIGQQGSVSVDGVHSKSERKFLSSHWARFHIFKNTTWQKERIITVLTRQRKCWKFSTFLCMCVCLCVCVCNLSTWICAYLFYEHGYLICALLEKYALAKLSWYCFPDLT